VYDYPVTQAVYPGEGIPALPEAVPDVGYQPLLEPETVPSLEGNLCVADYDGVHDWDEWKNAFKCCPGRAS
jgi:hypothetical protein